MSDLITLARVMTAHRIQEHGQWQLQHRVELGEQEGKVQTRKFRGQYFTCKGPHMLRKCKELLRSKAIYFEGVDFGYIVRYYPQENDQKVNTDTLSFCQATKQYKCW